MNLTETISPFRFFKPIVLDKCTKDDIKKYFNSSFEKYETLFSGIKDVEAFYKCPDRLRLPLIFYYAHTSAVFVNKLILADLMKPNERINFEFETIFETGVDEMSWDSIEHYRMGGECKWPTVEEAKNYRYKCRDLINSIIDKTEFVLPITNESPWWAILMGIEHENIHFETSSVLIRQYPISMVSRPFGWAKDGPIGDMESQGFVGNKMVKVDETQVSLGKDYDHPSFGWDNEYGNMQLKVTPFEASTFKVTNEEFLEFVLKGGYETREYWSNEGWEWKSFKESKHPIFWICPNKCKSGSGSSLSSYSHCENQFNDHEKKLFDVNTQRIQQNEPEENFKRTILSYKLRLIFDVIAMPANWPVEVNYHEAKAFCKWKGRDYRILSEAEHHAIRDNNPAEFNHKMNFGSSTPVNYYPPNEKNFHDVFGNVWEWTEDHFNALPGMITDYLYDDFSTPCYDGRHNIILGGSWASLGEVASPFGRYMFRRHFFQHCGFRIARSLTTSDGSKADPQIRYVKDHIFTLDSKFEKNLSDLDRQKYELHYYSTGNEQYKLDSDQYLEYFEQEVRYQFDEVNSKWVEPFISKIRGLLNEYEIMNHRMVHFGVSMGRVSFELANDFKQVFGLDYCSKFLQVAKDLQSNKRIEINLSNEIIRYNINEDVSKVLLKQITWIPNEIPMSDFVLLTMVERLTLPLAWLRRFREIVKPDGLVVIYSKSFKFNSDNLSDPLKEFKLIKEVSITENDSLTVWKLK